MNFGTPSPSELRAHQIIFYTQRMKDATSDRERAFLRAQLHGIKKVCSPKKHNHDSLHSSRGVSVVPLFRLQGSGRN